MVTYSRNGSPSKLHAEVRHLGTNPRQLAQLGHGGGNVAPVFAGKHLACVVQVRSLLLIARKNIKILVHQI